MADHCYAESRYAECHVLFIIMPNVIKLNVMCLFEPCQAGGATVAQQQSERKQMKMK
jgi:hypothetical protein